MKPQNKNTKRDPRWIKIKHSISSCKNIIQLQTLGGIVLKYHHDNREDNGELLFIYKSKEQEVSPQYYENDADTAIHRKLLT